MQKKNAIWFENSPKEIESIKAYIQNPKFSGFNFEIVSNVDLLFELLKDYDFTLVYLVIGDSLIEEFISKYKQIERELNIVIATIIFSKNPSLYQGKPYLNDALLNPGGVVTKIEDLVSYLRKEENNFLSNLRNQNRKFGEENVQPEQKNAFTFSTLQSAKSTGNFCLPINKIEEVIFPLILGKLIQKNLLNKTNTKKFVEEIYKIGNPFLSILVNPSQEKNLEVPLHIKSKYYMKMFGISSDFYSNMNKYLTENSLDNYKDFIFTLYNSLQEKYVESFSSEKLYRGCLLDRNEFLTIKDTFDKIQSIKKKKQIYFVSLYIL